MAPLERILLFVMLTVILASLFVPALDSGITESGKNENLQGSKTQYEACTQPGLSDTGATFSESSTPPVMQWNKTYGGAGSDEGWCVQQTSDGGYILAGYTVSFGSSPPDAWLVKTDARGNVEWNKTYNVIYGDVAWCVRQTSDGGYILAGESWPMYQSGDFLLIKTDSAGNMQWNKTYGGYKHERAHCVQQTSDGGFAVAGFSHVDDHGADVWLVKTDGNGNLQWDKKYGGSYYEAAWSIRQMSDGGYVIAGYADKSPTDPDVWLIRTDSNGNVQWNRKFGGTSGDGALAMTSTDDGGYVLAGWTGSYGAGGNDFWLVKTDSDGNAQWNKTYGGTGIDVATSVVQTADGGYTLAGYTSSYGAGGTDFWLVKTDSDGNAQWNKTYGGATTDNAISLVLTNDMGYAILGVTDSFGAGAGDFWLVKLAPPSDDLSVARVEPFQVVLQGRALIANKSSAVRVTIESTFSTRVWAEIDVTYDFGRKCYLETGPYGNGTPVDPGVNRIFIPGGPANPTGHPSPWISPNKPPWLLWTTNGFDSSIKAVIDPFNEISEPDETNNEKTCGMQVVESKKLRVLVIPVYFKDKDRSDTGFSEFFSNLSRDYLLAMFPIAQDKLEWTMAEPRKMPWYAGLDPTLIGSIYWSVARPLAKEATLLGYDRVVIVIKPIVPTFSSAISYTLPPFSNRVPVVVRADTGWNVLAAHELGHTYYLQHPQAFPNGLGPPVFKAQRFNVAERSYEDTIGNFMDPNLGDYGWIDKLRYDSDPKQYFAHPWMTYRWNLFEQLTMNPQETKQEVIAVSGVIYRNGTVRSEPWYRLASDTPDLLPETEGNYSFVLLNESRQIIARIDFNASFNGLVDINGNLVDHEEEAITFDLSIPYTTDTAYIEVLDSANQTLFERRVTENPPLINVTFPNGGEALTAGVNCTITWESSDIDGDQLSYFVAYSHDGGETWTPLALDIAENNYVWDTSCMTAGSNYLVKVIATDGINTGEDLSNSAFTLLDLTPPSIDVISPQNKTYFNNLIPLTFETDELTSWIGYSIDGQVNATLNSNTITNVEDGVHQIVLYANDTSGNMGSSEIVYFSVSSSLHDPWKSDFIGLDAYPIVDFAIYNGNLYAAADNTLYVYDGDDWNIVYLPTYVTSIASFNDRLIIGTQGGLCSYDGVGIKLIFQVPTYSKVLGVYNNTLYAGTFLDKPPTLYYCDDSVENPSNWHVDTGFTVILNFSGPFGSIDSFAEYNGKLYLTSGGAVYCYDETGWSTVKTYVDVYGFSSMMVYNGKLYLATRDQGWRKPMYLGGSGFSGRVIEFDGENWTTVFDHDYWIYSLETYNGTLYVGTANRIYTYNGTDWSMSFNAVNGAYYAISFTTFNGKIYVGMGNGYIFADPELETVTSGTPVVPEYPSSMILLPTLAYADKD